MKFDSKLATRIFALVATFFFTWQTTSAYAFPALGLIPKAIASVDSESQSKHQKSALLILNAHTSSDAQKNISGLLKFLHAQGIGLIGLEGADDHIDGKLFRDFPDKEALAKASWQMVKEGIFTGAEHFYITAEQLPEFYGLEDKALYFENREAFINTVRSRENLSETLESLSDAFGALKKKIYSGSLYDFDRMLYLYREGDLTFLDYLNRTIQAAKKARLPLSEYPNLYALSKVMEHERKISHKGIEKDLEKLEKKLSVEDFDSSVFELVKNKESAAGDDLIGNYQKIHRYFSALIQENKFILSDYKDFSKFYKWLEPFLSFESKKLFDELDLVISRIYERFAGSEKEKTLVALASQFESFEKMLSIQLTQKEWEKISSQKQRTGSEEMLSLITYELKNRAPKISSSDIELINKGRVHAERFYGLAEKRNLVFADKILRAMENQKKDITAVVIGGFHEKGLKEALEARGISTSVISPKIKEAGSDIPYMERMMGKSSHIETVAQELISALELGQKISGITPIEIRQQVALGGWLLAVAYQIQAGKLGKDHKEIIADFNQSILKRIPGVQISLRTPELSAQGFDLPLTINGKEGYLKVREGQAGFLEVEFTNRMELTGKFNARGVFDASGDRDNRRGLFHRLAKLLRETRYKTPASSPFSLLSSAFYFQNVNEENQRYRNQRSGQKHSTAIDIRLQGEGDDQSGQIHREGVQTQFNQVLSPLFGQSPIWSHLIPPGIVLFNSYKLLQSIISNPAGAVNLYVSAASAGPIALSIGRSEARTDGNDGLFFSDEDLETIDNLVDELAEKLGSNVAELLEDVMKDRSRGARRHYFFSDEINSYTRSPHAQKLIDNLRRFGKRSEARLLLGMGFAGVLSLGAQMSSGGIRSLSRSEVRWQTADLKSLPDIFSEHLAKNYSLTLERLEFLPLSDRTIQFPLETVKSQIAALIVASQAIAGAGYSALGKRYGEGEEAKAGIVKKEADGNAVSFASEQLQELARTYDVRIIVIGNEGATRDKAPAIPNLEVFNRTAKNGTFLFLNDAVEGTNYLLNGQPGAWSIAALLEVENSYSTDGYRATISYRAKHRAEIDPVIRANNTVRDVFTEIASANDQNLEEWARDKHIVILGDRKRHDDTINQLKDLTSLGLTYETVKDGDFVPRTLHAAFGIPMTDQNGTKREVIVMGIGGAAEHKMSLVAASLSRPGHDEKRGYAASRYVTNKGLKDDSENADHFTPEELNELQTLNDKIDAEALPVHKVLPKVENLASVETERSIKGTGVLAGTAITGARSVDLQRYGHELGAVQFIKSGDEKDPSGKIIVNSFLINEAGIPALLRMTYQTADLLQTRLNIITHNNFHPSNAVLYPSVKTVNELLEKLDNLDARDAISDKEKFVGKLTQIKDRLGRDLGREFTVDQENILSNHITRLGAVDLNLDPGSHAAGGGTSVTYLIEKTQEALKDFRAITISVAEKLIGTPTVTIDGEELPLISSGAQNAKFDDAQLKDDSRDIRSEARNELDLSAIFQEKLTKTFSNEDLRALQKAPSELQFPAALILTLVEDLDLKNGASVNYSDKIKGVEQVIINLGMRRQIQLDSRPAFNHQFVIYRLNDGKDAQYGIKILAQFHHRSIEEIVKWQGPTDRVAFANLVAEKLNEWIKLLPESLRNRVTTDGWIRAETRVSPTQVQVEKLPNLTLEHGSFADLGVEQTKPRISQPVMANDGASLSGAVGTKIKLSSMGSTETLEVPASIPRISQVTKLVDILQTRLKDSKAVLIRLDEADVDQLSLLAGLSRAEFENLEAEKNETVQALATLFALAELGVRISVAIPNVDVKTQNALKQAFDSYRLAYGINLLTPIQIKDFGENGAVVERALNQSLAEQMFSITTISEAQALAPRVTRSTFIVSDRVGNRSIESGILEKARLAVEAVLLRQDVFQSLQNQENIWIADESLFQNLAETLAIFRQAAERILAAA